MKLPSFTDKNILIGMGIIAGLGIINALRNRANMAMTYATYPINLSGKVTSVIDGDTIKVKPSGSSEKKVRITLVNTPEYGDETTLRGYTAAKNFTKNKCYGKTAYLSYDTPKYDIYGRLLAMTRCGTENMNQSLRSNGYADILTQFCSTSKFSHEPWASPPCWTTVT